VTNKPTTTRECMAILTVMLAVVIAPPLRAGPITGPDVWVNSPITSSVLNYGAKPGELEILTYHPGADIDMRQPDAPGIVRFLLWPGNTHGTGNRGLYEVAVNGFAFNTDLALTPSQFSLPAGWTATPNALVPGVGTFSWVLAGTTKPLSPDATSMVGFDISGLGDNTALSHFVIPSTQDGTNSSQGSWFAADIVPFYYANTFSGSVPAVTDFWASGSGPLPAEAPEPSTLLLLGLGLGTCAGFHFVQRLRPCDGK
jgi:hypothetical protein